MNIVITGSLGNIGKPLTRQLLQRGHAVTVISSQPERQKDIETLGATAAIGNMEDAAFLLTVFKGVDIVYCMETFSFFKQDFDYMRYISGVATNYKQAIEQSGVRKVIHLSSIGAHISEGNGILKFHHLAESILGQLPESVAIKFIRPVGFYTNLYGQINSIRSQGIMVSNFGGDRKEPWVSPLDIAAAIAEEMELPFENRKVRYVASDEVSSHEIAAVLGKAIGKPDLKWVVVPDNDYLEGLLSFGMNRQMAEDYVKMQAAQLSGKIYEDYYLHKPLLGKVKLADFAKEFAAVYRQQ